MSSRLTPLNEAGQLAGEIPNIDISHAYEKCALDADIHYERLENLAGFFGHSMPVHHHDRFYQIHIILTGVVRVCLEESRYTVTGPMFFLTPPAVPHSFVIDENVRGYVITVRQQLVWELMETGSSTGLGSHCQMRRPLCLALSPEHDGTAARMLKFVSWMSAETDASSLENTKALKALLQLVLIDIYRLAGHQNLQSENRKEDVRIFNHFNELIEAYYRDHLTVQQYSKLINVTESRLNEVCRRVAGLPSKRLIIERLMLEARRSLVFSSVSISEISYALGFKDPAYFARFFRRHAGLTAGELRKSVKLPKP